MAIFQPEGKFFRITSVLYCIQQPLAKDRKTQQEERSLNIEDQADESSILEPQRHQDSFK